jgi:membrane associated rhomboid family serine protease
MMHPVRLAEERTAPAWGDVLIGGAIASLVSAAMLAACGKAAGSAPLNGPSQWVWGERAAYSRTFSVRKTIVGYAIHHLATTMWAALHEATLARLRPQSPREQLAAAASTAIVAYTVDYGLTPPRLRPGFKKHLGPVGIGLVYGAFACGLALWPMLRGRR